MTIQNLDSMAKLVPLEAPWMAEDAKEWDETTLGQWIDKHLFTEKAKALL